MKKPCSIVAFWCLYSAAGSALAAPSVDWLTFGGNAQRTLYNGSEKQLSTSTVPQLKLHWSAELGSAAYFQPDFMRGVKTATGRADLVFVSTNLGVTALDAANGQVVWTASFAMANITCDGKQKSLGTTEPPTIDADSKTLYVVDGAGLLHALAIGTGAEQANYPVEIIDAPNLAAGTHVSKASPTLVGKALYITTAASCEESDTPYHGQIMKFDLKSATVVLRYYPTGNGAVYGGGVWGPGGVSAEPDDSFVWAGTANSLPPPQNQGNAEKLLKLTDKLKLVAVEGPTLKPGSDYDFGATPLLFQPTGCPPMLAAMNKSGIVQIYDRTKFGSGALQTLQISKASGSGEFFGMPAWDPVTNAIYVSNPADSPDGTYGHGLVALQANASCQMSLLWQQTAGVTVKSGGNPAVPPLVANGVVWYAGGIAKQVNAFDAATGKPLWDSGKTIKGITKASPMVANGQVFFLGGTRIYAYGL
jgi:outer membrane protein assembly factor BamB